MFRIPIIVCIDDTQIVIGQSKSMHSISKTDVIAYSDLPVLNV